MLDLFATKRTPKKAAEPALPAADSPRPGLVHIELKAGDMPVIRRSGNLEEWRALHSKTRPAKLAKSGSQHLKEMRAERAARGR